MHLLNSKIRGVIFLGLIALINLPLIFNTYALTDGWWETYAWMVSLGLKPYQDFYLAFPPLFVILQEQVLKIFGDYLIAVRFIGLVSIVIQLFIVYRFLRFFSGTTSALLGVAVSYGFIYQNGNYLVSDYHNYVSIFGGLILVGVIGFTRTRDNRRYLLLGLAGLSCGLLFLTKQNNAVFLTVASIAVIFIHNYLNRKVFGLRLLSELLAFILAIVLPLAIASIKFDLMWYYPYFDNDSKGSLSTVFLRFILDTSIRKQLLFSVGVGLFGIYAYRLLKDEKFKDRSLELLPLALIILVYCVIFFLKGVIAISMFAITWVVFRQVFARSIGEYLIVLILMAALTYCGTQSAGLNNVSLEFLIAISFSEVLDLFIKKYGFKSFFKILPHATLLLIAGPKIISNTGYEWWGYESGQIITRKNILENFDYFQEVSTDSATANAIHEVYLVKQQIKEKEKIFAYPSIPIIYKLLDKPPQFAPVLWFDVVSDQQINKTLMALKESSPNYIFWLRPQSSVYEGHFSLKRKFPSQLLIDEYIINEIYLKNYQVKSSNILGVNKSLLTINFQSCLEPTKLILLDSCRRDPSCKINGYEINYSYGNSLAKSKISDEICLSYNKPIFYILKKNDQSKGMSNEN